MTLPVSIGLVTHDGSILLIRRENETYNSMLALPGGKVKDNEHEKEAIRREIKEEAGINCTVQDFHGLVSEILYENSKPKNKFSLSVFNLEPQDVNLEAGEEGDVGWYNIENVKDQIIPSDLKIIQSVIDSEQYYFECKMADDELEYFEPSGRSVHGDDE